MAKWKNLNRRMAKLCIRYEDQYVHLQKKYHHDMQLISLTKKDLRLLGNSRYHGF